MELLDQAVKLKQTEQERQRVLFASSPIYYQNTFFHPSELRELRTSHRLEERLCRAVEKKQEANKLFGDGNFHEAMRLYEQAYGLLIFVEPASDTWKQKGLSDADCDFYHPNSLCRIGVFPLPFDEVVSGTSGVGLRLDTTRFKYSHQQLRAATAGTTGSSSSGAQTTNVITAEEKELLSKCYAFLQVVLCNISLCASKMRLDEMASQALLEALTYDLGNCKAAFLWATAYAQASTTTDLSKPIAVLSRAVDAYERWRSQTAGSVDEDKQKNYGAAVSLLDKLRLEQYQYETSTRQQFAGMFTRAAASSLASAAPATGTRGDTSAANATDRGSGERSAPLRGDGVMAEAQASDSTWHRQASHCRDLIASLHAQNRTQEADEMRQQLAEATHAKFFEDTMKPQRCFDLNHATSLVRTRAATLHLDIADMATQQELSDRTKQYFCRQQIFGERSGKKKDEQRQKTSPPMPIGDVVSELMAYGATSTSMVSCMMEKRLLDDLGPGRAVQALIVQGELRKLLAACRKKGCLCEIDSVAYPNLSQLELLARLSDRKGVTPEIASSSTGRACCVQ